ncbi:DUF6456 domain-containing protein [Paracoccus saliphilus]|uniref:Helix-turn-helix domain-containing protein n=1 Tax=Paracoccus saliphilus TaxID=405559 RepID=A0AA46A5V5_9RHOB|nr:DUF6456 domain-containing protein [Paracoccus saliphilus]WCR04631.1 helix-turn-helix domain-containing protein [Paracoccus saliphilus]SIS87742.1 Helix-turn-helix domain-containing protein [Paracoccus saliphilus]
MIQRQNFPATHEVGEPRRQAPGPDTGKPDDVELYLRHIRDGVPIRALARELGCHASTVLRRVRRFEERRDDPLVDAALSARAEAPAAEQDERQFRQVLRRLAEPGAVMVTAKGMEKAIVTRDEIRTAVLDRSMAEAMALRGWVAQSVQGGRIQRYVLVPAGREALRRMLKTGGQDAEDHAGKHRVQGDRIIEDPEDGRRRRTRVNLAESPLLLLARHRDMDGQPFLTPGMVAAGERLREDFELAQMGPRVTQNWEGFLTAGIDVGRNAFGGGSISARDRVAAALRDLGPGLGDVALRICCFLEGMVMTERRLGWTARSGKIVLRLALMRLERHYEERYGKYAPPIG